MSDYLGKLHHALDLGVITVTPSEGTLDGTRAILRVGRVGKLGTPESLRYLLNSEQAPDEPALFTWTEDDEVEGTWNLRARLSAEIVDIIGVGGWTYELSIVTADDEPIWGEAGTLRIAPALPEEMAQA